MVSAGSQVLDMYVHLSLYNAESTQHARYFLATTCHYNALQHIILVEVDALVSSEHINCKEYILNCCILKPVDVFM